MYRRLKTNGAGTFIIDSSIYFLKPNRRAFLDRDTHNHTREGRRSRRDIVQSLGTIKNTRDSDT